MNNLEKNPSLKRTLFLFSTLVLSGVQSSDDDTRCFVKKIFLKQKSQKNILKNSDKNEEQNKLVLKIQYINNISRI